MEVFGTNPFHQGLAIGNEPALFFRGGRRQELLQYIRHLSCSLYDLVIVVGPRGIGKSCMLRALQRQLTDDLVDLNCLDAKAYVSTDDVQALILELSEKLNLNENNKIANDPVGSITYQSYDEPIKPLICIDHVEAWSEELLAQFFSVWAKGVGNIGASKVGISKKEKEFAGLSLPFKCLLWVDQSWLDEIQKSVQARQLLDAGYVVKVGPLNRVDMQKYLEYKLNLAASGRFKFSKKEVNEIYRRSKGVPSEVDRAAEGLFCRRVYRKSSVWSLFPKSHAAALICVVFGLVWLSYMEGNSDKVDQDGSYYEKDLYEKGRKIIQAQPVEEVIAAGSSTEVAQDSLEGAFERKYDRNIKAEESQVLVGLVNESTEVEVAEERVSVPVSAVVLAETLVEMVDDIDSQGLTEEPIIKESIKKPDEILKSETLEAKVLESGAPEFKVPKFDDISKVEKAGFKNSGSTFRLHTDYYTVQLMAGRDLGAIERRKGQLSAVFEGEVTHFETLVKGRPWYVLVAGVYESRSKAEAASRSISAKAQFAWSKSVSKPWVRQIKSVID